MAEEIKKVITIDVGGSAQTVKGLKDEINNLRDALLNAENGSQEYKDVLSKLVEDQKKLTSVMNAGKGGAEAAAGSYNALVNEMAALKKVWKETTDETARGELGKQINDINDKLKGMDASIGNYQRNVGNYSGSIKEAFNSMGGAAKGMIGPISNVNASLKTLAANPIVAVFSALALVINGIVKGFKSSEENMNKLTSAFAGFQAIGDGVTKVLQGVAGAIGNVANGVVNLLDKWGLLGEKFKEREAIAESEIELAQKQRKYIVENADLEKESAELKNKAEQKNMYTAQERLDFLKKAADKEKQIAQNNVDALQQEYEIIKEKNSLSESSAEDKEKEAQAYANLVKAQTDYFNKTKELNSKIVSFQEEVRKETKETKDAILTLEKDMIQQEYDLAEAGSREQLDLAKKLRRKELEITLNGLKEKLKNKETYLKAEKMAVEKYNRDILNLDRSYSQSQYTNTQKEWKLKLMNFRQGSSDYYKELKKSLEEQLELRKKNGKNEGESDIDYKLKLKGLETDIKTTTDNFNKAIQEETQNSAKLLLNSIMPESDRLKVEAENMLKTLDGLKKLSTESDEAFSLRKQEIWKNYLSTFIKINNEEEKEINRSNALMNSLALTDGKYNPLKQMLLPEGFNPVDELESESSRILSAFNNIRDKIYKYIYQDSETVAFNLRANLYEKWKTSVLGGEDGTKAEREILDELGLSNVSHINEIIGTTLEEIITGGGKEASKLFENILLEGLVPGDMIDTYISTLEGLKNAEDSILQQRVDNWMSAVQAIGDLVGNLASYYEADIDAQVENGELTEEQASKEYKKVQQLKVAQAIINTISGAIAAYTGSVEALGMPAGPIVGAIQAAAVTAAGAAQIKQIESTNPYSSNSSSLSGSFASATPSISEYTPQYTRNITTQDDTDNLTNAFAETNIQVSVTDINDVQNKVKVRDTETSF